MPLSSLDLEALARARRALEHPGLAIRIADAVGTPVEALVRRLPDGAQAALGAGTRKALDAALGVALRTLDRRGGGPSDWLHRGVAVASGALGGAAGLPGLLVELPFSLTVMLRAIAAHARAQGEDLTEVAARLECLTVFAYGSRSPDDDAAESAYFAARVALARAVSQAAEYVAERGIAGAAAERGAPAVVQLVARIAQRLGAAVSDKAAAQLLPVLGAAGGAAVNALFMSHYQETAWAHFTVRRLERAHGAEAVRAAYRAA
ncbi:MAG TPA: EcsC family protein [Anaeromyxobacteraceae bacterium]|nr:EcsC family protein [Anaeromyxobacteraceae bacterium]